MNNAIRGVATPLLYTFSPQKSSEITYLGGIVMKKMNSINETYKLCNEHNIGISRRVLLTLVKSGEIPSVKAGRSILVN